MRFLKTGIFIAFLIAFSSCSSDDDKGSDALDPSQLIGKWYWESTVGQEGEPSDCERTSYSEFFNNGETYTILNTDNDTGECVPLLDGRHEYELVSKDKIHFKLIDGDADDEFDATIVSISATKLVLKDFVFPGSVITFKKQ